MFQTQYLFSSRIRLCHPWYTFPSPHESTWTGCQVAEDGAAVGERFLVRRDYDQHGDTWIVREYVLTRATDHVFYGWTRQLVAYYVDEVNPYPYYHVRLCQPVRFSQHIPEWGVIYDTYDWMETVCRALIETGVFADAVQ